MYSPSRDDASGSEVSRTDDLAPARFELRAFAPRLARVRTRLRRRGQLLGVESDRRLHLIGRREDVDLVIRDGRLEVRRRVERHGALERWRTEARQPLPLDAAWARRHLPELLGVPVLGRLGEEPLRLHDLVLRTILPSPDLAVTFVQERRWHFRLAGGVRGEHGEARVAGLRMETAAVEGGSPEAVRRAGLLVGLDPGVHASWVAALRVLCAVSDGPGAGRPGAAAPP